MICAHSPQCSGCPWIDLPQAEQEQRKIQSLRRGLESVGFSSLPEIEFVPVGDSQIRDRADLVYQDGKFGFYEKGPGRTVFSLQSCPLMSSRLQEFYQDLRKLRIPIQKGSLRIRVSPSGERGLWLDFANEDVRDLLKERTLLQSLLAMAHVEIGQRRKHLSMELKLKDPVFHPWTQTWAGEVAVPLYSVVGGFSQSGDLANRQLIRVLSRLAGRCASLRWVEFGAGCGNLTIPLASVRKGISVQALEFDDLALQGLRKSLDAWARSGQTVAVDLQQGDFQRKEVFQFSADQGVLVNPPRSGLMKFLDPLLEIPSDQRPREFLYMSCHLDSFLRDSARMKDLGYQPRDLAIVDQFPHTPHFEILSRWER